MLSNITIGQYFPTNSRLHKLAPSIKMICSVLLIVSVFLASTPLTVILNIVATFSLIFASKIKITMYLKMLKAIWPIVLLTAILNTLYSQGEPIASWWIFTITYEGIYRAVLIAVRICLIILISSLLTYTTSPTQFTDGLEQLLSPLRYIGLAQAVHTLALMMSIALRFIPILVEEADKIISAQKARGADMESGGLFHRVKAMLPILIPLLISAVRRAIDLADAMECRCYQGGKNRTKMNHISIKAADIIAIIVVAALLAATIIGRILN